LVNVLEEFRALKIEFASLHEGVNTSTPDGRLVVEIFASITKFERELIGDRVQSNLAGACARGHLQSGRFSNARAVLSLHLREARHRQENSAAGVLMGIELLAGQPFNTVLHQHQYTTEL
jgi:DNA invertase Pin-like site-specific DNA recombinase